MGRWLFLVFLALVVVGMAAFAWVRLAGDEGGAQGGGGPGGGGPVGPPLAVAVETIGTAEFAEVVEALGTVRARESVTLTARVTDVISLINFESGDIVAEGDVLVELASGEVAAESAEARTTYIEAQRELARFDELMSRGIAPQQRIDELRANVSRALARVRAVEARLGDRVVRAPFAGVVGLRDVSPGALVRPGDAVATLDAIDEVLVDFTVPELYLGVLSEGAEIRIASQAFPDEVFPAVIDAIGARVDPVTRAATLRARAANPDGKLRPGMLMLVEVRRNVRTSLAAPSLSVLRQGEEAFVYVVAPGEQGQIAQRRTIVTGARLNGKIEVLSGLEAGERVVSEGTHRVQPGRPVRIAGEGPSGPGGSDAPRAPAGGRP